MLSLLTRNWSDCHDIVDAVGGTFDNLYHLQLERHLHDRFPDWANPYEWSTALVSPGSVLE